MERAGISPIEGLDDPHLATAAWADWRLEACRGLCLLVAIGVIGFGGGNIEQRSTQHELVSSVPIRKQAVVADAMKAIRQDVEQKAAHELADRQSHGLALRGTVLAVILPAKADMVVVEIEQPAIGDGDTVGVARKISQDLDRACERTFGENDPDPPPQKWSDLKYVLWH